MDAADDADDICPVCDGQCTCHAPLAPPPVLKIKLTLPPSMRVQPKKRGRPPKYAHKRPSSKRPPPPPPRKIRRKKIQPKRRRSSHSSSSELTDLSDITHGILPTFIPAEDIVSSRSSSDQDDTSDSDSESSGDDSEIQAEEESFIRDSWFIKSRNASVPPESRDPEIQEEVDDDDNDDDDDDNDLVGGLQDEDDDDETDQFIPTMRGLATGWSEDEESSFDADLFFANLDASDSSRASSPIQEEDMHIQSSPSPPRPAHTFDIAEDWTGTLMFTNGIEATTFMMDMELDADDEDDGSMSSFSSFSRHSSPSLPNFDDLLEEDDDYDGESTDEELVGPDGLPTPRLMKLFRMPTSVGVVNPQSTSKRSDEEEMDIELEIQGRGKVPVMGRFADNDHQKDRVRGRERIAIITDNMVVDDIPCPFGKRKTVHASPIPSFRNRSTSLSSTTSTTTLDLPSDPSTPKSLPFSLSSQLTSALSTLSTVHENEVDITDVLAPEFLSVSTSSATPSTPDLKSLPPSTSNSVDRTSTDVDDELKHLHRWDVISVGAYRRTRHKETDNQDAAAIAAALHTSPMASLGAAMLYQQNNLAASSKSKKKRGGDKTPTPSRTRQQIPPPLLPPPSEKKLNKGKARRKEKEIGAVHHHHRHHQSHPPNNRHHRGHFPNSKRRSTGAVQRASSPLISGL